jgi:hypothetical protein
MTFTGIIALLYSNKYLRQLRKLIESGRGTFSDTFRYTDKSADILGDLFYGSVLDMPDEERITSCVELLRDRHKDINGLFDIAQRSLDKKAGLSIAPQHVPFDEERAKQIGASLTDKTVPETTIQRRAKSATANATRSMHDDCIEANAKFRAKAGLQCYITRTTDGSCCKWCTQMAGRYEYGSEPKNVYRRHDNCGCMVTYENGRKRQNVWSKKTWEAPADDAGAPPTVVFTQKQAAAAGAPPPKSFTKEEAQELNSANVKKNSAKADSVHNSSIDKPKNSDIMELREGSGLKQAKKRDRKIDITDIAIDKITHKTIPYLDNEQNQKINLAHKTLLTIAKNENDSNEVAYLIDLNSEETAKRLGSEHEVNIFENPVAVSMAGHSNFLFLAHNHPSTKDFSYSDLGVFLSNDSFKGISVVSNTGDVHILYKSDKYDFDKAYEAISDIKSSYGEYSEKVDAAIVKDFLKISKSLGIIEY